MCLGCDAFGFFKGVFKKKKCVKKPVGLAELLPSARCFEREGQTMKTLRERGKC